MNDQAKRYWIPKGVPPHLRPAYSIPGDPPISTTQYWDRLEFLLAKLAKEWEEWEGPGSALRVVKSYFMDEYLHLQPDDIDLKTLMYALMHSDNLIYWDIDIEKGGYDPELQYDCRQINLEERLSALTELP